MTVKVSRLDEPGVFFKGRLANLSAHGLGVIIGKELPEGSVVKVEWGSTSFVGELVFCQPCGKEFLAGLQVEEPVYETAQSAHSEQSTR